MLVRTVSSPTRTPGHRRHWDRTAGTAHALKTHRVRRQNTGRRSIRATRTTAKRRVEMSAACKYECGSVGHTTEASAHTVPASTASSPWSMFRRPQMVRRLRVSRLRARRRAKTTTVERVDHTLPANQFAPPIMKNWNSLAAANAWSRRRIVARSGQNTWPERRMRLPS